MKRILLLLLLTASLFATAQPSKKQLYYHLLQQTGATTTTAIQSAEIVADNVYYTNENLNLDITIAPNIAVTQYRWVIKDHGGLELVRRIAFSKSPTIPALSEPGWYDIECRIITATDQYTVKKVAIPILPPKPTTPDLTINLSAGNFYNDFANDNIYSGNPIKYIKLTGSGTLYLAAFNLWGDGSDWEDRIYFYKDGDSKITLTSTGTSNGVTMTGNKNILWNGYNDDKTRGFRVNMATNGQFGMVAKDGAMFDAIGVFGTEFVHNGTTDISLMRFESPSTATFNATNAQINGLEIYDNYFEGAGAESFYLGNSKDDPAIYNYIPTKITGAMLGRNESYNSQNEAYQIGCMLDFEMWENYAESSGLRDTGGHRNCYQITAGSTGRVLNNFAINSKIPLHIETGLTPWDVFNGETSVTDGLLVDGNIFINGTEVGAQNETSKVYMIYGNTTGGAYTIRLVNNTFFSKQQIAATDVQGAAGGNIYMVNNVCIGVPTGEDHNELKYLNANPTSATVNNSFRSYTNYADLISYFYFSGDGTSPGDYDPTSLASPIFSGSPTNISGLGFDFKDYNSTPFPSNGTYTFGAFNGYGLKTITPDVLDTTPPTFTTATVTNITEATAELHTELDKDGITYWSIIADGGTAPTVAQLIAGGFGLQSGSFTCPDGVEITEVISGLIASTAYDVYRVAVNKDNTAQVSVTKNDITTGADVVAPVLSAFYIPDANKDRIYFTVSEDWSGSTYGGFTVANPTKTITAVTKVSSSVGYFTVSAAFTASDDIPPTIAYSGSGSNIADGASNALASFSATAITPVPKVAPEDIVWTSLTNAVDSGGGTMTSTGAPNSGKSTQIIPSTSDGEFVFDSDLLLNTPGSGAIQAGLMLSASSLSYANIILALSFGTTTVSTWENDVYKAAGFYSGGGIRDAGVKYIVKIDRATQRLLWYSEVSGVRTLRYTSEGTYTGNMCVGFYAVGDTTTKILNGKVQAYNGF